MSDSDLQRAIDEAILSLAGKHWRKVAMIVVKTESELAAREMTVDFEVIAERIYALVEGGRLEGAGNFLNWRHSEVRLPRDAQ